MTAGATLQSAQSFRSWHRRGGRPPHPRAARGNRVRRAPRRRGLSLLEAILAAAILGMAIAAVGEAVRIGTIASAEAQEYSLAQILCESKLTELTSGLQPLTNVTSVPLEVSPDWLYSITMQPAQQQGLLILSVTVARDPRYMARPVSVTLHRWMLDPTVAAELQAQADALEAQRAEASAGSSSGGAAGASTTGGSGNG